jgi:hypothetical protein
VAADPWEHILPVLSNPAVSLQLYGHVQDQAMDQTRKYDPEAITEKLQSTIIGYVSNPPTEPLSEEDAAEGLPPKTRWLNVLAYRQGGKSLSAELAFWCKTEYTPGWEHVCAADDKDRADYLFERVIYNRERWPKELLAKQRHDREVRSLSLEKTVDGRPHGGKMAVITGGGAAAGVGRGTSSFHGSELPLWKNAAQQFSLIYPSMINRRLSLMLKESTPFPLNFPSAPWYRDECAMAKTGQSRSLYAFFPFWDGKLNQRAWPKGSAVTIEEQRLLDAYYKFGLRKRHLAFRREVMATDAEIMKRPELFKVYYPFDDITCWVSSGISIIKDRHLERHLTGLVNWLPHWTYHEYSPPIPGAKYVIGVDPSGYGVRDHASFQVLQVFEGEWEQVAVFASEADPPEVARKLAEVGRRYNNALVCVERNGVGLGIVTLLQEWEYPNIYYDRNRKPGIHTNSHEKLVSDLVDALDGELVLHDEKTVAELQTYQNDKLLEISTKSEALSVSSARGTIGTGRRARNHWDRASALMMAVQAARSIPQPRKPKQDPFDGKVVPFKGMTLDQIEDIERRYHGKRQKTGRATYQSVRRRK